MAKMELDEVSIEQAALQIERVLDMIGLPKSENPGMKDTPRRFLKYLLEFRQPLHAEQILKADFDSNGYKGMVVQTHIPFRMICEHHLLPAIGFASLGYIPAPKGRVVGLSKLSRLVDAVGTERPSLQEHICDKVVDLLEKHIKPLGSALTISAKHGCMACRGVNRPNVMTTTTSVRGVFRTDAAVREEFFHAIANTQQRR